ncbi:MAG: hypothetical protein ACJAZP_000862 [Psychromonas sp.]|jgi:hypothetical protein|uniref:choice-of-anchor H family protein n=1 Tax=Psychromonas sp. TaxID=1884585 RepID=UPI0039E64748
MNSQLIKIPKHNAIINMKKVSSGVNATLIALVMLFGSSMIDPVNADELTATQSTISYGVLSETINDQMRLNIIDTNYTSVLSDQLIGKATGEIRNAQKTSVLAQPMSRSYAPEFTIYNAFTTLLDDFDGDGYYQTFSVIFDADIYSYDSNDSSAVYARLYLSDNGGPWINYYTTDDFIIHSDSDQDEYEVITSFASGYNSNNYDLLIDLYQVGYDEIVATYSSNDNQALYALPLESGDYDRLYVDRVYVQAGSFSSWLLIILFLLLASRFYRPFMRRFHFKDSGYKK